MALRSGGRRAGQCAGSILESFHRLHIAGEASSLPSSSSTSSSMTHFRLVQSAMFSISTPPPPSSSTRKASKNVEVEKNRVKNSLSKKPFDPDQMAATQLVDDLLLYTHSLMIEEDHEHDDDVPPPPAAAESSSYYHGRRQRRQHLIAFSGGIDSSVVAALVYQCAAAASAATTNHHQNQENEHHHDHLGSSASVAAAVDVDVTAVLGLSPAVPADQIRLAEQVANHIGIHLEQIPTTEGSDDQYIANNGQACLACKTHLYTCLRGIVNHYNNDHHHQEHSSSSSSSHAIRMYNGTNADDLKDPTRLGLIAATNFDVKSPLQRTPKHLVRIAGRHLGLPNWQHAASPCLRSRLALGVEAVPQHLQRIEQAETFVRQSLHLRVTHNLRVRLMSGNRAMIEVDAHLLEQAQASLKNWKTNGFFTKALDEDGLGFAAVDVRAFKTGSVATPSAKVSRRKQTS